MSYRLGVYEIESMTKEAISAIERYDPAVNSLYNLSILPRSSSIRPREPNPDTPNPTLRNHESQYKGPKAAAHVQETLDHQQQHLSRQYGALR
jgi:hypothetical protein